MTLIRRAIIALALLAGLSPAFAQAPGPVPALPDAERRTSYQLTASTCACAVGFQLYGDSTDYGSWVEVFVNGVRMSGGWTITSPTGPLATIPRPITDAVLTFASAQTGTVQIVGARRPRRVSQFSENRGVAARDLNQVITDIVAQNRENWDKTNDITGRVVLAPPGETLNMLPPLASRLNTGACFDNGGNLIPCATTPPTSLPFTFTQIGTGAVPVSLASYLQTIVTPEQFGAACNGTGDDGPAIQRAIDSNAGRVQVILSPTCVYRVVTGIVINKKGVRITGAGRFISTIDYEPTGAGTLFTIGDGVTRLYGTQLRDFSIISADTTFLKVGFKVIDVSETILYNLSCSRTNLLGNAWLGGGGSTCLQTNGRDTTVFEKLILFAEQPVVLNLDPAIYISTDHFVFRDLELIGAGFPCITANDGIVMTNTSFEGYQTWSICTYGFFANDTTSVQNWNNVAFHNVRLEQTINATAFSFYISVATGNRLIGLTINNTQMDTGMKGVLLRNVQNATIQNSDFPCTGAAVALDLNATNDSLRFINDHFETACTFVNSGGGGNMVLQWAASYPATASSTIPSDAIYGKQIVGSPMFANALGMPKIAATGVAPGAGQVRFEAVAGTNAGTCKIIAYAGTSGAAFTVLDNIGGGC